MTSPPEAFDAVDRAVHVDQFGIQIGEVIVVAPDGSRRRRTYLHTPEVVAVVAIVDGDLLLVREFRAPVGIAVLALPMGKIRPGSDALTTAATELAEETGFRAQHCEPVATLLSCPGWMDQVMHIVRASGCHPMDTRPSSDDPDDVEEQYSSVVRMPIALVANAMAAGELRDARSIAAIHLTLGSLPTIS